MRAFRDGRIGVLVWGLAAACTGPNPAWDPRLVDGGGGSGGSGLSDGTPGLDGTTEARDAGLDVNPVPGDADPGGSPDRASDGPGPVDLAMVPDAPSGPPDLAPDLAPDLPPDLAPDLPPAEPVELTRSLLAYWSFNESMGSRAEDGSSSTNDGTLQNGAIFETSDVPGAGANSHAARFGGGDDHMTIAIQNLPRLEDPKTIALWLKPTDRTHSAMRTIVALATSNDSAGVQLGTDQGRPAMWRWGASAGLIRVATAPPLGWYHLAYTWDGQNHRLYFNGTLVGTAGGREAGPVQRALLASYDTRELGEEMYVGLVDELRIYSRVLNQSELTRLAQGE